MRIHIFQCFVWRKWSYQYRLYTVCCSKAANFYPKNTRRCFLNLTQLLLPVKWYRQMIHCDCFFMKKQQNHKAVSKDKPETRCICNPRPLQLCASIFRFSWVSGLQNSSVSSLAGSSCHLVAVTAVHHILLPLKLPQTHRNGKQLWR